MTVATNGTVDGGTDATYGYETLGSAGTLTLGQNLVIDVSGGAQAQGGNVDLQVPLVEAAGSAAPKINVIMNMTHPASQFIGVNELILEAYGVWSTNDTVSNAALHFDGHIDPAGTTTGTGTNASGGAVTITAANHKSFYQTTLFNFVQNALNVNALAMTANNQFKSVAGIFHLRPGIDLRNPNFAINNGDISVDSAWNLAAGVMGKLQSYPTSAGMGTNTYFDPALSTIQFLYRYAGVEPGDLTLQAARNINVTASISDGFFDYENFLNSTWISKVNNGTVAGTSNLPDWLPLLFAPIPSDPYTSSTVFATGANSPSPSQTATSEALASYDLFPHSLNVVTPTGTKTVSMDSWSYHLTSGANFSSANPNAMNSLASVNAIGATGGGDVIFTKSTTLTITVPFGTTSSVALPTMLRTGVGDIAVSAARDLILAGDAASKNAPGVIYSAGRDTQLLPTTGATGTTGTAPTSISNPDGFLEPNVANLLNGAIGNDDIGGKLSGAPTAAAFPEDGGDIVIQAQRDIIGYQNVTYLDATTASTEPLYQYYAPWVFSQSPTGSIATGTSCQPPLSAGRARLRRAALISRKRRGGFSSAASTRAC